MKAAIEIIIWLAAIYLGNSFWQRTALGLLFYAIVAAINLSARRPKP